MQINTSGAALFGNMTQGGGLPAVFDNSLDTVGYVESVTGWAGATLAAPKRIDRAELTSFSNGFDSSGLTSSITLQLRAKNGAAPSSHGDGFLLGSVSFTDQNSTRTITVESSDKATEYQHVWAVVLSGVWSTLVDVKLYEAPEPEPIPDPETLAPGSHVFIKSCDQNVPLTSSGAEIQQFRIQIALSEPRKVLLDFHGDVIHVGSGSDAAVAVGFSFWLTKRSAPTLAALQLAPFVNIRSAVGGGNVAERNPQHYGNKSICTAVSLDAGFHEFSVIGNGHTDGSSTQGLLQVLSEYGMGINCLRVTVLP